MAIGLDPGTMFIVKAEMDSLNEDEMIFMSQRNAFLEIAQVDDAENTLKENHWAYAKHQGKFYVLGEDALKLKNLLTIRADSEDKDIVFTQVGQLRRPMKDGVLNTAQEKLSVAMIQKLIESLVGKTKKKEYLCFCCPGKPVDKNFDTDVHQTFLTNILISLGYTVDSIPEALAIIFSEIPVAQGEDGEETYTGIAMSFGAGMCNVCLARRKIPLINFAIAQSGDWIDRESAKAAGLPVSAMTSFKEKKFSLEKVDYTHMKQACLDIHYQAMIRHAVQTFSQKFNSLEEEIDVPLEIVVAGGTASVPGFMEKFQSVLKTMELPFKVKNLRMAKNPLYAVARGCLLKAINLEQKSKPE